jgi:hypothetical protein
MQTVSSCQGKSEIIHQSSHPPGCRVQNLMYGPYIGQYTSTLNTCTDPVTRTRFVLHYFFLNECEQLKREARNLVYCKN